MADVRLRQVRKRFGDVEIIKGIDLDIEDGEFCVFVGPSGCGKSTLLRMVAGLEDISSGEIAISGRDMTRVPPANRGVAMVFQSYALYPHMTVEENLSFGLKMAKAPKDEIERRVKKAGDLLQLGSYLQRKPSQLSGGQRQRVAIGRAIVREPDVFLFDEPLSNLDTALRVATRIEIGKLHQDLAATMIYVTHDQVEAMTMADKIVVLNGGLIEQVGSPLDLYQRPDNLFVAGFIGSPRMNFLPVLAEFDGATLSARLPGVDVPLQLGAASTAAGGPATLGIRPEHVEIGDAGDIVLEGRIRLAEHLGAETMLYLDLDGGGEMTVSADGIRRVKPGERISVGIRASHCHLFDAGGQAIANASAR